MLNIRRVIYIYRDSLLHWCQAGADVKENLKNWAKQQEAELAEDGDSWFLKVIELERPHEVYTCFAHIYIFICASLEHTSCIKPRQTCPSTHVDFKCNQMFVALLVQNYFCFQVGRCPETNWDECHMYLVWFYLWVDPPLDPLSFNRHSPSIRLPSYKRKGSSSNHHFQSFSLKLHRCSIGFLAYLEDHPS